MKRPSSVLFVAGERRDTRLVGLGGRLRVLSPSLCASVEVVWLRSCGRGWVGSVVGCGGGLVQVGLGFDGVWFGPVSLARLPPGSGWEA